MFQGVNSFALEFYADETKSNNTHKFRFFDLLHLQKERNGQWIRVWQQTGEKLKIEYK